MTATANVVLQLGTKLGPGGFTDLKSFIDLTASAGRAIIDAVASLDKFSSAMKNVDMQIVNYADSMAKGQVDTTLLMQKLNALNTAGLKPTKEQFAAMSKAATKLSQDTGKTTTEAFNLMTEAIMKGTAEGLIPFGVQLKSSGDKVKDQHTAIEAITKIYGNLDIRLSNNSQRLAALSNSWGTLTGVLWDAVSTGNGPVGSMIEALTEGMGSLSDKILKLDKDTKQYLLGMQWFGDEMHIAYLSLKEYLVGLNAVEKKMMDIKKSNAIYYATGGKLGAPEYASSMQGIVDKFVRDQREKEKGKATTPVKGGAGGAKENPYGDPLTDAEAARDALKNIQKEQDEIVRKKALESQKNFELEEQAREMMDLALGMEKSLDYQAKKEEEIAEKEKKRIENIKENAKLLGLENEVSLEKPKPYTGGDSIDKSEELKLHAEKYDGVKERVDAMMQQQEDWEDSQVEFRKKQYDDHVEFLKLKKAEYEFMLAEMGIREEAIQQIMQMSKLEADRAIENIKNTQEFMNVTDKLGASYENVHSIFQQVERAYKEGTEKMTTAEATFFYIGSAIAMAQEIAEAAGAAASYDYFSAALHTTSAAGHAATIALAAAHGGGSGSGGIAQAAAGFSAQSTHTAGRYSGGYSGGQGGNNEVTLLVSMNPTLAAFGAFVDLNDRAARSGDQYFKMAG
jgi:hypothetical protein